MHSKISLNVASCAWRTLSKGSPCVRCGYKLRDDYNSPPYRTCGNQYFDIGTKLSYLFYRLGFRHCQNCEKREAFLNRLAYRVLIFSLRVARWLEAKINRGNENTS